MAILREKSRSKFFLICLSLNILISAFARSEAENIHFSVHQTPAVISPNNEERKAALAINAEDTENEEDKAPDQGDKSVNQAVVEPAKLSTKLLQGEVNFTVPRGTPIKLKLATVPSCKIKLMDHDLDGNLYPAKLGQLITAKTTEDIYVDESKVIPEGTVFCGKVSKILPPRRLGRPGSLVLSFNQLITPDGKKFAFRAEADNSRPSTAKSKAKGLGIIAAHTAGGAIVGALVAYQLCGLEKTISMHGYNIAAGAAAGALIATGYAVMRKGPHATLEPGDDLNMTMDTELLMPIASEVQVRNLADEMPELKIEIHKKKIVNDGLGAHLVTIEAKVINGSDKELSSIDLFLEDSNGDRHPLCSSPEEDSQFLFHLEPHSERHVHLSFLTNYPKLKQHLVWLDHHTKLAVARQNVQ